MYFVEIDFLGSVARLDKRRFKFRTIMWQAES